MPLKIEDCTVDLSTVTKAEILELHSILLQTGQRYWDSKQTLLDRTNQSCLYLNMGRCWSLGYYRTNINCTDFINKLKESPKEELQKASKGIPIIFN